MYPQRELKDLATNKSELRLRIALRRLQTMEQADRVLRPVRWVDHAVGYWRQIAPFAKLAAGPLGFLLLKTKRKGRWLAGLMKWGPTVWSVVQGLSRAKTGQPGPAKAPADAEDAAAAI